MWQFFHMIYYHLILISLRAHRLQIWISISHGTTKFGYFSRQCLRFFWGGIINRDPNVAKPNRLHVDIFWVFFIILTYFP